MSLLKAGAQVEVPELPGKWSVWSQAADAPGAYFVVPLTPPAHDMGLKYAVIRAIQKQTEPRPTIHLLRTDPHRPELFTQEKK